MKVIEIRKAILAVVVLGLCGLAAGGSALEFDGVDDYVDMGDPADGSLDFGSSIDFTVVAWINTVNSAREDIVGRDGTKARHWELMVENNRLRAFIDDGSNFVLATDDGAAINDGEWHQVAVVFDRDGMMERYVDGGAYGTADDISSVGNVNTDGSLYIGCRKTDGDLFDGTIDEVGIYDRALSASEIEEIYHCGVFDDVNLVGYWGFEEGAGQVAYDGSAYGNDGYLGSDPNGADSADPVWAESEVPGVTYHVDVVGGDNGNDGLTKETAFAAIQMGIDSAEDCDTVLVWPGVYNESLFFINKGITVQSAADAAELVASGIYAASLYTSEGPESILKNFVIRDSDTGVYVSSGSPWLEHLTVVNCDLGIEAEAGAEPNIVNSILWNNAYDLFQCEAQYSWVEEDIEANVVAYWRFEEGSGTTAYDWTGDNDGTIYGAAWTTGKVGGALEFDGTDDWVTIPQDPSVNFTNSSFTIAAWIKPRVKSQHLFTHYDSTSARRALHIKLYSGGTIKLGYYDDDLVSTAEAVPFEAWSHVTFTYDYGSDTSSIYVNGLINATGSEGPYQGANVESWIGKSWTTDQDWDGLIDEVGIWDRALSAAEVRQLYESGLAGHDYIDPVFADADGGDYHLKSERGRYWPEHDVWVLDEVSSPCIDAGDARVQPSGEPAANGGRINMGAYGNTAYASMSEWGLRSDFDHDGAVGLNDVGSFTDEWLEAVTYSQEPSGSALEFDGVDDYVVVSDDNSLDIGGAITVGGWINLDDNVNKQIVLCKRGPGGGYEYGGYTFHFQNSPGSTDGVFRLVFTKTNGIAGSGGGNYGDNTNWDRVASDKYGNDWHTGAWYHVAGTWDGSTNPDSMKLYINGQAEATHTASQSFILTNSYNLTIGDILPQMSDPLNARLDDVCIYNRALDGSEIGQIYHCGVAADVNLVGYWGFEEGEGQVAADGSGNGNDGQLGSTAGADSNDPVWVESDVPGVTYHVDGAGGDNGNDGLTRETAFASIQFGIDTAEGCDRVLVWPGVYNESLFFINKGVTVRSAAEAAELTATGLYAASFYNFGGGDATISNFVITDSDTGVYVSSGQPELTNLTVVGNWMGVEAEAAADPNINSCIFWGNDYDLFQCTASYSLVEEQVDPNLIAYWELDGDATDSAGSNDGTIYGATPTTGQIGEALEFDGDYDYVNFGDIDEFEFGDNNFSIAAWFYSTGGFPGDSQIIINKYDYGDNGRQWSLDQRDTGEIVFYTNPTGLQDEGEPLFSQGNDYHNKWVHVVCVREGSNKYFYIDGVLDNTGSTGGVVTGKSSKVMIGCRENVGNLSRFFNGKIDDVGIYDRALSAEEVERIYEYGLRGHGLILEPFFADANGGDYHLLSKRGRYWPGQDVWVLDDVTSPGVDGGDPSVAPAAEPMPNGARVNMGAYGGTAYASMSEWPMAGDMDEDGIVNMVDYGILADEWLKSLAWAD